MASWAGSIISLSRPVEGGHSKVSKMQHLRAVWASTGVKPAELLAIPDPPQDMMYLWQWLNQMAHPLSYMDLQSWCVLTGRKLSRWEVEALTKLDRVRTNV